MEITPFAPFFLVFFVLSFLSIDLWIFSLVFISFFQAATPFNFDAIGRPIGIMPTYLILFVGLLRIFFSRGKDARYLSGIRSFPHSMMFLAVFFLYSSFASLILPEIFEKTVSVAYPVAGTGDSLILPLQYTAANLIQSFYCLANLVAACIAYTVAINGINSYKYFRYGVIAGLLCVAGLGVYQFLCFFTGLAWPEAFINSNAAFVQLINMEFYGFPRISSTFTEPSFLAMHILACFGLFYHEKAGRSLAVVAIFVLLISTSTTAYAGLVVMGVLGLVLRGGSKKINIAWVALPAICFLFLIFWDYFYNYSGLYNALILDKADSSSYEDRSMVDGQALRVFIDTYGLGVGYGSHRASSMILNMIAATGLFGILTFFIAIYFLYRETMASLEESATPLFYAFLGMLVAEVIAVPDIGQPIQWIYFGFVAGIAGKGKNN